MNNNKEIGGLTLTATAAAIVSMMYFAITIDYWTDTKVEHVEPACTVSCAEVVPVRGDPAIGIKNTGETITVPPQTSQEARDKYRKRSEYRARNMIGWT